MTHVEYPEPADDRWVQVGEVASGYADALLEIPAELRWFVRRAVQGDHEGTMDAVALNDMRVVTAAVNRVADRA